MDIIQELIDKGWKTVNIKTSSIDKEELLENVILDEPDFGKFDFGNIAISPDSVVKAKKKESDDENTIRLEGSYVLIASYVGRNEDVPAITREAYEVKIKITKVS